MDKRFAQNQIALMKQLRLLWEQHVYWTRFFIISTAANLRDLEAVTDRLLRNPHDFAKLLLPFYGEKAADRFHELLTQHLLIAADLVNAAKKNETARANEARRKWYHNADEIADFLSKINPFWNREKWKGMLYDHLEMTEKEAMLRLAGKYAEDIRMFDNIEKEALEMADFMSYGMIRQFGLR